MRVLTSAAVATLALVAATFPIMTSHADDAGDTGKLVLLLDSSGSMKESTGGGTRIEAAKDALNQVVDRLPDETQVGIRVFGATIENRTMKGACTDTQNVVPVGPLDRDAIKKAVADYKPYGETPIGSALLGAAKDLGAAEGDTQRTIVLLSDGEPNCKPDPCPVARQLAKQGINLKINVVGLNVNAKARKALQCIAKAGNGEYVDAANADELAAGLVRSSVRDLRAFKLTGELVEGGPTLEEALPLEAGVYLDTSLPGEDKRHYLIDIPEGGGVGVSALVRPGRDPDSWHTALAVEIFTPDGTRCDVELSQSFQILGLTPITTTGLLFNQFSNLSREECHETDQLVAAVNNKRGVADYQLVVNTYPAITNADQLPEQVEDFEGDWTANVRFPKGGPVTEVVGGVSPEQAPTLEPGTTYADTLRPTEQLVYKVPVGYGQALRVSAQLLPDARADDVLGLQGNAVNIHAVGPTGQRLPRAFDSDKDVNGGGFYNGHDRRTLTAAMPPIRVHNNLSHNGAIGATSVAGDAYIILGMGTTTRDASTDFAAPVRIRVETVGEVSGEPEYAGEVQAASASPSPEAEAEAADEPEESDESSNKPLIIGGLSLFAALIGAGAYLIGRRSKS